MPPNYNFDAANDQENIDPRSRHSLGVDESNDDLSQLFRQDPVRLYKSGRAVQSSEDQNVSLDKQTATAKDNSKALNSIQPRNLSAFPGLPSQKGVSRASSMVKSISSKATDSPDPSQKITGKDFEDDLNGDELGTPDIYEDESDNGDDEPAEAEEAQDNGRFTCQSLPAKPRRSRRELKPVQINPYSVDKIAVKAQKSKGRNPTEAEVKEELEPTQTKPKQSKKKRVRHSREASLSSDESAVDLVELDPLIKLHRTVLRITIPGESSCIDAPFTVVNTLPKLIDLTNRRWGAIKGSTVQHLVCKRFWLGSGNGRDLLIYEDWDEQFDALVSSILEAEVWKTMFGEQKLEVIIEATLKDRQTPEVAPVPTPQSNV
ncbi:uncharacterized protein AB675_5865 [Cyphellophora attinorum]|uniref:Uncharacterized protein n=1 Tax=Cyphellophora attinorum TaxID=1664694 RepID=A0A0N1H7E9_9EURO|nr:uncharacterized protein AB675_5865 [Phialophora attinorum]KPI38882.1 hypothetical protein AB675_5865 [Phialophora attinorum]